MNIFTALLLALSSWRGGLVQGDVDPTPGQEFIQVDESGAAWALTGGRQISTKSKGISLGSFGLVSGERILTGPTFIPGTNGSTTAGSLWVKIQNASGIQSIRGIQVDATKKASNVLTVSGIGIPIVWGPSSDKIAFISSNNGSQSQVTFGLASEFGTASWNGTSTNGTGNNATALLSSGDTIWAVSNDGNVTQSINASSWIQVLKGSGTALGSVAVASGPSLLVAGVDIQGHLNWSLGGVWNSLALPENIEELAPGWIDGHAVVRVRFGSGRIADVDLGTKAMVWHLRQPLERLGFLRTSQGGVDLGQGGSAPSGSGVFSRLWSRIWGTFHHNASIAVSDLLVSPNHFSPLLQSSTLVRLVSAGSVSATWTLDVTSDSSANPSIIQVLQAPCPLLQGNNDVMWNGSSLISGHYWIRAKVISDQDSLVLWGRILLDRDKPTGTVQLSSSSVPQGGILPISTTASLVIDGTGLNDLPFGRSGLSSEIHLSSSGIDDVRPWNPNTPIQLDGRDVSGITLPDGDYSLLIKVSDSAGNSISLVGPWTIGATSGVSTFRVRSMGPQVTGVVTPIPAMANSGYKTGSTPKCMVHARKTGCKSRPPRWKRMSLLKAS